MLLGFAIMGVIILPFVLAMFVPSFKSAYHFDKLNRRD